MTELYIIWAAQTSGDTAPWVVDAWDEYSIDENGEGWTEAVEKAKSSNAEVRITKILVDYDAVKTLFTVTPTIVATGLTEVKA